MTLCEALKSARLQANLTQKQVAEALHISQPAVAQFEKGQGSEPSVSRLIQLANLYKISLDVLVGRW